MHKNYPYNNNKLKKKSVKHYAQRFQECFANGFSP